MRASLFAVLLAGCALADDAKVRSRLEGESVETLSRLYYMEWGRAGIEGLREELAGEHPSVDVEQARAALTEMETTFSDYDWEKPLPTLERLLRSGNPLIRKLGMRILSNGGFDEALPILAEVDPPLAEKALERMDNRRKKGRAQADPATDPVDMRDALLGAVDAEFKQKEAWPKYRQMYVTLGLAPLGGLGGKKARREAAGSRALAEAWVAASDTTGATADNTGANADTTGAPIDSTGTVKDATGTHVDGSVASADMTDTATDSAVTNADTTGAITDTAGMIAGVACACIRDPRYTTR